MNVELLISLVSEYKELYDKRHSGYKLAEQKEVIWQAIADKMGINDVEEVKAKWRNLRDTYIRKKREEQDGTRSGQAAKRKKEWKYTEVMGFIAPSIELRSVHSNIMGEYDEVDEPDEDSGSEPASTTSAVTASTSAGRGKRSETPDLLDRYLAAKDVRDREKEERRDQRREHNDEATSFLNSLAPALRRLPPRKQSSVKLQMQQILHDAEFAQPSFPQFASHPQFLLHHDKSANSTFLEEMGYTP